MDDCDPGGPRKGGMVWMELLDEPGLREPILPGSVLLEFPCDPVGPDSTGTNFFLYIHAFLQASGGSYNLMSLTSTSPSPSSSTSDCSGGAVPYFPPSFAINQMPTPLHPPKFTSRQDSLSSMTPYSEKGQQNPGSSMGSVEDGGSPSGSGGSPTSIGVMTNCPGSVPPVRNCDATIAIRPRATPPMIHRVTRAVPCCDIEAW